MQSNIYGVIRHSYVSNNLFICNQIFDLKGISFAGQIDPVIRKVQSSETRETVRFSELIG